MGHSSLSLQVFSYYLQRDTKSLETNLCIVFTRLVKRNSPKQSSKNKLSRHTLVSLLLFYSSEVVRFEKKNEYETWFRFIRRSFIPITSWWKSGLKMKTLYHRSTQRYKGEIKWWLKKKNKEKKALCPHCSQQSSQWNLWWLAMTYLCACECVCVCLFLTDCV